MKHIVSLCIVVTLLTGCNSMITKGGPTDGVTDIKPESVPESFVDNEIYIKQTDISLLLEGSNYHPYMDESIGDIVGKYPSNTFTLEERTQEGWDITLYRATLSRFDNTDSEGDVQLDIMTAGTDKIILNESSNPELWSCTDEEALHIIQDMIQLLEDLLPSSSRMN